MTKQFEYKRISDSVHGSIGLSELEARVIDTRAFQRLRGVKQLGLVDLVFPGAGYSRFSHSIGVCHVAGKTLENLARQDPAIATPKEIQRYRLAALLHDIGHYPFSHTMEEAIHDFYTGLYYEEDLDNNDEVTFFNHERAGREALRLDPELKAILEPEFTPDDISRIFMREERLVLTNLVSSDLDADRIDYLLRNAHHTGLPYGHIDAQYLLSQMTTDDTGRLCLTSRALRTAEHFLLSRYFDYQQVIFHKSVVGLEMVLKDVLIELLRTRQVDCSRDGITKRITQDRWSDFDDAYMHEKIRELYKSSTDDVVRKKAAAILYRKPPRLIASAEYFGKREDRHQFIQWQEAARKLRTEVASKFGVDERQIYVWDQSGRSVTKAGSHVPVHALSDADYDDGYEQSVRIGDFHGDSTPIMKLRESLISVLADYAMYTLRFYVLDDDLVRRRDEVYRFLCAAAPDIQWKTSKAERDPHDAPPGALPAS